MFVFRFNSRIVVSGDWFKISLFLDIYLVWNILDGWYSSGYVSVSMLEIRVFIMFC